MKVRIICRHMAYKDVKLSRHKIGYIFMYKEALLKSNTG